MDRSTPIELIAQTIEKDELLVERVKETPRQVYAQVRSVTSSEFFEGGRNGLNPEYRFTVFFGDYQGERVVKYQGQKYAVYRTYQERNDKLELYCERQGGVNGEKQESNNGESQRGCRPNT